MNSIYDNNEFSLFEDDTDASILEKRIKPNTPEPQKKEELKVPNINAPYQQSQVLTKTKEQSKLDALLKAEGSFGKINEKTQSENQVNHNNEKKYETNDITNIFANTDSPKAYDANTKIYPPVLNTNQSVPNSNNKNEEIYIEEVPIDEKTEDKVEESNTSTGEQLTNPYLNINNENESNSQKDTEEKKPNIVSEAIPTNIPEDYKVNGSNDNVNNKENETFLNDSKTDEPKKKPRKGLKVFGIIFLILIIVVFLGIFLDQTIFRTEMLDKTNTLFSNEKYFGEITLSGEFVDKKSTLFENGFSSQYYINCIKELKNDKNNKGLILKLDSPGGSAYTSNQILRALKSYHAKKPIAVVMGSIAASGAYLISSEADYIVADESTLTGSIGVTLGTQFDISEFLSKNGIKTDAIVSGSNKNMGSIFTSMSKVQRDILQGIVNDEYLRFLSQIEDGRKIDVTKNKDAVDGRIMTAKTALEYGMIDKIGNENDALVFLNRQIRATKTTVYKTKPINKSFFNFIFSFFKNNNQTEFKDLDLNSFNNIYNILSNKKNSLLMMFYEGS